MTWLNKSNLEVYLDYIAFLLETRMCVTSAAKMVDWWKEIRKKEGTVQYLDASLLISLNFRPKKYF